MKRPVVVLSFLLVAFVGAFVLGTFVLRRHNTMPDLSGYEVVGSWLMMCPRGVVFRVGYNRPGSDPSISEAVAFYRTPESLRAQRPFAVALFETDVVGGPLKVYIDRDLDGRVDVAGQPGEHGIKEHPCDELPYGTS